MVYANFEVMMQWNRSESYAMTVGHLAELLRAYFQQQAASYQFTLADEPDRPLKLVKQPVMRWAGDKSWCIIPICSFNLYSPWRIKEMPKGSLFTSRPTIFFLSTVSRTSSLSTRSLGLSSNNTASVDFRQSQDRLKV